MPTIHGFLLQKRVVDGAPARTMTIKGLSRERQPQTARARAAEAQHKEEKMGEPGKNVVLSKIVQIALGTRDLQKAIAFYRDTLGLKLMFEVSGMAFFEVGAVRLMIGPNETGKAPQGDAYLYFDAGDWAATEAALERRGVKFDRPTEILQRAEGKEHALRFFKDPDGNFLAIMGWRAA
jgi:methylmalonyl-CoA/ethylmalonyl-CoA epimerase